MDVWSGWNSIPQIQILVIYSLVLSCIANPVVKESPALDLASYAYAIDLSASTPPSAFQCMQGYYDIVFIRGYVPTGQGYFDPYACANIRNASAAGFGTEVYMTPQPSSVKTGSQQFDEMYGGLKNANINVRSVWIQVTAPVNWFPNSTINIKFLNSVLSRANQYDLSIGIYTNFYDWDQITGGVEVNNVMLCYWNTYGIGSGSEPSQDFSDFRAFGGWNIPSVKQYGQAAIICDVTANLDVCTAYAAQKIAGTAKYEKSKQIIVGSLGLGDVVAGMAEIKQ